MSRISSKILNRVEVTIKENTDSQVYSVFQDWINLINIQQEIQIKPNVVEFDSIPGYRFHGLKMVNNDNDNPLTFNFECDYWEDNKIIK